jgi:hypothetical protein
MNKAEDSKRTAGADGSRAASGRTRPIHFAGGIANMDTTRRWSWACLAVLGLALPFSSGCQTNVAGMTLPSGRYLTHAPQYIPPSPPYPLSRELAQQEAYNEAAAPGAPGPVPPPLPAPLPPPVPAGPPAVAPAPAPAMAP